MRLGSHMFVGCYANLIGMNGSIANSIALAAVVLVGVGTAFGATPPPLTTSKGAVAADNAVASEVGARVLEKGGSAADAAIATALALGVVSPSSSGIGGGGFAVIYVASEKRVYTIDFREVGPAAIQPSLYRPGGVLDPLLSRRGGLAVGVPGEVAGLQLLWQRGGRLPWKEVVEPARQLAHRGFAVGWFFGWVAEKVAQRLDKDHPLRLWLSPKAELIRQGRFVRRSHLANTLRSIAEQGASGFYKGPVAQDLVSTVQAAGGVLSLADLAEYKAIEGPPLLGTFRGYQIATMPLPSSGGMLLLEMLGILDAGKFDLKKMGSRSSAALHLLAEVSKHAFADRARFLGDHKNSNDLVTQFLDKNRFEVLAKRISMKRVGKHEGYGSKAIGRPGGTSPDGGTSHLCVVDAQGNAVAMTTTVNGYFGSSLVGRETGVILNNQMDDFSLAAGVPNMFGLVQSEFNLVAPGKRPLSSMTPTLVLDDSGVVGCFGGSGGPRIISNTLQTLLNVFVHGMDVREAVATPRLHHQWIPKALSLEADTAPDVITALRTRGHEVNVATYKTAVQAIIRRDGKLQAASDPRKGGRAAVEY